MQRPRKLVTTQENTALTRLLSLVSSASTLMLDTSWLSSTTCFAFRPREVLQQTRAQRPQMQLHDTAICALSVAKYENTRARTPIMTDEQMKGHLRVSMPEHADCRSASAFLHANTPSSLSIRVSIHIPARRVCTKRLKSEMEGQRGDGWTGSQAGRPIAGRQ
jgi:hypothetical protein